MCVCIVTSSLDAQAVPVLREGRWWDVGVGMGMISSSQNVSELVTSATIGNAGSERFLWGVRGSLSILGYDFGSSDVRVAGIDLVLRHYLVTEGRTYLGASAGPDLRFYQFGYQGRYLSKGLMIGRDFVASYDRAIAVNLEAKSIAGTIRHATWGKYADDDVVVRLTVSYSRY